MIRSQGTVGPVVVDFVTSSGSATRNEDFLHNAGTLLFNGGQNRQTIVLRILQVRKRERNIVETLSRGRRRGLSNVM